jgi:hypothetical protein
VPVCTARSAFKVDIMANMSVRGLDDKLLAQLKRQAKREGSSLNSLVPSAETQ